MGARRTFLYHFSKSAMLPYIIMNGLRDGVISKDVFEKYSVRRQKSFSI